VISTAPILDNTMIRQPVIAIAILLSAVIQPATVAAQQDEEKPWAYRLPQAADVPEVKQSDRVINPIDAFILQRLEKEGIEPAALASRQTLIRRLYFDLIGLPPTPAEVQQFVENDDAAAYQELIDRLLDDPRYGERWARYWLDLARYADTAGYEGDPDLPHAWRYRDYVIDAFNNDKPYDLFIKEQIAGDEFSEILGAGDLPGVDAEKTVAMTFLRLAPFTEPRGDETRHEMLSEMTSTVGSVFLGLTVGCAKCHDHKYDAIPTRDFYRMKAFFATVQIARPEPGDSYQIGGPLSATFYREGEKEWAAKQRQLLQTELAESAEKFRQFKAELEQRLGSGAGFAMQSMGNGSGNNYFFDRTAVADGKVHFSIVRCDDSSWSIATDGEPAAPLGSLSGSNQGEWFASLQNPEFLSLGMHTAGSGKPQNAAHQGAFAELLIFDHPLSKQEAVALTDYLEKKYQSDSADLPAISQQGLRFWLDAADLDADSDTANPAEGERVSRWVDRAAGLQLVQSDESLQPIVGRIGQQSRPAVSFSEDFLSAAIAGSEILKDREGTLVAVYTVAKTGEGYGLEVGGQGSFVSTAVYPDAGGRSQLEAAANDPDDTRLSAREKQEYYLLANRERFIKQQFKRLQPLAMSLRHSYGPPYEPGVPTSRVMIRGEFDNPGEVVVPGFPSAITGNQDAAAIRLDPFKRWPMRSRRMALAQWIASKDNPLTARVMVNRLWHWHFGGGIVATPSDFGFLGGGPSHPELLDWMALQFVELKWSVKAMHRLICNSSTYRQQSVVDNTAAAKMDPENRLYWRANRRRLEGEAIRDSVLAVSGRLNPQQHGLPIFPPLPGDIAQRVKYTDSKWDTQFGPQGRRRSLYIYQQRTLTMPLLQTFDALVCDESRPRRATSVTPLQALAMYNGEFVNDEAQYFAQRLIDEAGEDAGQQIELAFQLALGRAPTDDEEKSMVDFVNGQDDRMTGLVGICRVLYNTSEFLYVD